MQLSGCNSLGPLSLSVLVPWSRAEALLTGKLSGPARCHNHQQAHPGQCRCRMLRQVLCSALLRSAIGHGHVALRHVSSRTTGAAIFTRPGSQSYLTKRSIRRTPAMSATTEHKHTNRLAQEQSPYLLQHQYNPVCCLCCAATHRYCAAMPGVAVAQHQQAALQQIQSALGCQLKSK